MAEKMSEGMKIVFLTVVVFGLLFIAGFYLIGSFGSFFPPSGKVVGINCNQNGMCRIQTYSSPGWVDVPWSVARKLEFGKCYDPSWNEIPCPG